LCTLQRGFELIARKAGHPRAHTWGRLLPGWAVETTDSATLIRGPAGEFPLPPGVTIDQDGFLVDPSAHTNPIRYGRRA
jgi:hypothetical protein